MFDDDAVHRPIADEPIDGGHYSKLALGRIHINSLFESVFDKVEFGAEFSDKLTIHRFVADEPNKEWRHESGLSPSGICQTPYSPHSLVVHRLVADETG